MRRVARSMAGVAVAGLAIGGDHHDHGEGQLEARKVPTALRAFWADGFFAAAQDAFILSYLGLLAAELGAGGLEIGLLTAGTNLGALLALYPGAIAARRAKSRRWIVLFYAGVLGRLLLLSSAFAIAFLDGNPALYAVIAIFTLRAFLGSYTVPAWTSLAADIIPPPMRARYFASRSFAMSMATLAITPLAGLVLDGMGFPGGYVAALVVSFAFGMCATVAYARIPEPERKLEPEARKARPRPLMVARDARFRSFVIATFAFQFSVMLAGPFFNVYLKQEIGGSNFDVGWLSTASALAGLFGQLVFGDMMSRRGALWLQRGALLIMPTLPWMWLFVSEPWMVLAPNLIGGFAWSAFNLANFQLMLEMTREEDREEYVAVFHMVMFAALLGAPFLGGWMVDTVGYKPVFAISGAGRVISLALFTLTVGTPVLRVLRNRKADAVSAGG